MTDEEMLKGCMANKEHAQKFLFNKYCVMQVVNLKYNETIEITLVAAKIGLYAS